MILKTPFWTVHHEGGWETIFQNNRPYVVSTWIRFEGKFKSKAEAKMLERKMLANPDYKGDKMFVLKIDQKKALEIFQREWELPDHGIYGKM